MIHKIILGTAQIGSNYGVNNKTGKINLSDSIELLDTAFNMGVRTLDTAETYGDALETIGIFHKKNPSKTFDIINKLDPNINYPFDGLESHIRKYCNLLSISKINSYMFHNYKHLQKSEYILDELTKIKQNGLIKNIGISLYSNSEILNIINKKNSFDFIQIPFNLLDNELKRGNAIMQAKKAGIKIHVRSIFLQGLFMKKFSSNNIKLLPLEKYIKRIKKIADNDSIELKDLSIQYCVQKKYIDRILIGVDNQSQLIENIKSFNKKIDVNMKGIDSIDVKEEDLLNPTNW
tara:strand:+ start:4514 stop:5386 length:873 start_codon:yes stop_codon:yes gene_type:complete